MDVRVDKVVDARGLACPMPVVRGKKAIDEMASGKVMELIATDKGALKDFEAWVNRTGNKLLDVTEHDDEFHFFVKKS
ncbi:MAG: sulfurtransferase TusA family protein [Bacillaceae bacterium]|nr:sulfurtransferase TusA family protein [Bacillaceae bacterium]